MRYTTAAGRTSALLLPFIIAGCFSLSRKTPVLEQYVLGGAPATDVAGTASGRTGLTIGLRQLDLAAYLATPAIVVRRGTQQIVTSEFHRWGEDLNQGINRALARYLAAQATVGAVNVAPWPVRSQYDYLIQLHVSRFEGVVANEAVALEGEVQVAASWEIIRQQDGAVLARGESNHRERGWRVGDYAGLVTLLDGGLNAIAQDLDACLGSLGPVAMRTNVSLEPIACVRVGTDVRRGTN